MKIDCESIERYLRIVEMEEYPVCREQKMLCAMVRRCFQNEGLYVDKERLEKYLQLQKYFPYKLFPWEEFVFTLHICVYTKEGQVRWPELLIFVGRGAGKNGYLAFEDFALLTPINGIRNYDIDIFANNEDQAKRTFEDVYDVLECNRKKMERHFSWNKEQIRNIRTGSVLRFKTSNPKTKDGSRPGKVDFDEYHQYGDYKMVDVATTGLGKKADPRKTIITTDGDVRDGPLDHTIERAEQILQGAIPDNGLLPYICRIDDRQEIHDELMWHKANPSLRYLPTLMQEMKREYENYKLDQFGNVSFMTKRMNRGGDSVENAVTSWENIKKTNREMPDLEGLSCIAGIDYAKTTDFVAAGLLFEKGNLWYWLTHTWVCKQNKAGLSRIRFPLEDAARRGLLTFVDEVEIPPEAPANWLEEKASLYDIEMVALDSFRYQLMRRALAAAGFDADKKGRNNIKMVRPSDIMQIAPVITSKFAQNQIIWGDDALMRWYTNNTKQVMDLKGNISFGKIEPKSRKTDGFMAFVAAATGISALEGWNDMGEGSLPELVIYG